MDFDISVVVTAHSESVVCGRTLRSAEAAIAHAESAGLRLERLVCLDTPAPETLEFFTRSPLAAPWAVHQAEVRDPGKTRNHGAALAAGRYVAFIDADDLVSENWLTRAHAQCRTLEAGGRHAAVHPELLWRFGLERGMKLNLPADHPFLDPRIFPVFNPFDAMFFTARAVMEAHPFRTRDLQNGYAFEDWAWFMNTYVAGVVHGVARDTVVFKRRRLGSINADARQRKALLPPIEGFGIEEIAALDRRQGLPPVSA